MTSPEQLSLFEQVNTTPLALASETSALNDGLNDGVIERIMSGFTVGDRIQITHAGVPLEHLNGQKGTVVGLTPDAVSVQVEGIAVALRFRPDALERWTSISEYTSTESESVLWFRVGDRVECHAAFLGQVGIVNQIGLHCGVTVAWVNYGSGKPLYPCALEHLTLAE